VRFLPQPRDGELVFAAVSTEPARELPAQANEAALDDVGFTAAFSASRAEAGISCNVLAGVHPDRVLVPVARAAEALEVLRGG
jgi:hypothetical protein